MSPVRSRRSIRVTALAPLVAAALLGVPAVAATAAPLPPTPQLPTFGSSGPVDVPMPVPVIAAGYDAAQALLGAGRYSEGLAALDTLASLAPRDANIPALQAFYSAAAGNDDAVRTALLRVEELDAALAERVRRALDVVDSAATVDIDYAPAYSGASTAIVVLGFGLLPDGTMRPELEQRLRSGVAAATASPLSPIVVTGGNPQLGRTEAAVMRDRLVADGIPAERIHVEDRATDTPTNATFTAPILRSLGATNAVLATSTDHIRRSISDFRIAGVDVIGAAWDGPAPVVPPVPADARLGLITDATKTVGIPRFYPV